MAEGGGLLTPPLAAFLLVYVGALVVLFISSFWTVDSFTGKLIHHWTLSNYRQIFDTGQPYLRIAGRTIGIAAAVTLTDAILAFPLGYFMARRAQPAHARVPLRDGAAAALVELPRSHLRLADDPRPRRRDQLGAERTRPPRSEHRVHELGDVARVLVRVAAVHGSAGLRRARADPRLVSRSIGRPRRARLQDAPLGHPAARAAGRSSPARSSRSRSRSATTSRRCSSAGRARASSGTSSTASSASTRTSRSRRRSRWSR